MVEQILARIRVLVIMVLLSVNRRLGVVPIKLLVCLLFAVI